MNTPKLTLAVVLLIQLIGYIGIALPYPIFAPLFLSDEINALNQFQSLPPMVLMGLVLAIYPLGLLMGGPYLGALSDRVGRKPVLFWSLLGTVIANGFSAYAIYQQQYLLLFIARFMTGLLEGNIAVARAIVTDLGDLVNKTRAFGYMSAASYSGYLIGPIIAGSLAHFGYWLPFAIASLLSFITVVFMQVWLPETTRSRDLNIIQENKIRIATLKFLQTPYLASALLVYVLATFGVNTYYEFYPVMLVQKYHMESFEIAYMTVAITGAMIVVAIGLLEPLEKLMGRKWVVALGFMGLGGAMMLLIFNLEHSSLFMHFIFSGICIAMYNSLYVAWLSDKFKQLDQGRLMGFMISAFCLTNVIMAITGSYLALVSFNSLMMIGGLFAITSGLWFLFIHLKIEQNNACVEVL